MNYSTIQSITRLLLAGVCLTTAASSPGAEFWLRAGTTTAAMPDGRTVTLWGFANDGTNWLAPGAVSVPGPQLVVPAGDTTLLIHLTNTLPEAVSIVIPGQYGAVGVSPAFQVGGAYDGRVRSVTTEALPGTAQDYTWNNVTPGTYLYHSGSHLSIQLQMGLYGALTTQQGYSNVVNSSEVTLLFSEIDPDVHDAVAGGSFGPGPAFLASDFTNAAAFITQLTNSSDPVAVFVAAQISGDPANLASDLNAIIGGPSVYDPSLFPDAILSAPTIALLSQDPPPTQNYPISGAPFNGSLVRMNRLMLQDGLANAGIAMPSANAMTSTIRSYPQYFLVNGSPFPTGLTTNYVGAPGQTVLVRLLNASADAHVPTLINGGDFQLIGEDGQPMPFARSTAVAFMPALKTLDALWSSATEGVFPIADRRLGLANGVQPGGGMLTYLQVSSTAPTLAVSCPAAVSVADSQPAVFSVTVSGGVPPLSYQWLENGATPVGGNSPTLSLTATMANNGSNYSVTVIDSSAVPQTNTSCAATLTVTGAASPLTIAAGSPANLTVADGQTAGFAVLASGGIQPYHYQWYRGASPTGTDSSVLSFAASLADNNSTYYVTVTDSASVPASVTSSVATLSVTPAPVSVVVNPAGLIVETNQGASFTAVTSGTVSGYAWSKSPPPTVLPAGPTYTIAAAALADAGTYTVQVTGAVGPAAVAGAVLDVFSPPLDQIAFAGGPASVSVTPAPANPVPLHYEWSQDGNDIGGDTNLLSFASLDLTNAGTYAVLVSGTGDPVLSDSAILSVVTQPGSVAAVSGQPATLSVTAASSATLGYQWQKQQPDTSWANLADGGTLSGSATPALSFSATAAADAGNYRVVVSGPGGPATSATATLTIITIPVITGAPQPQTLALNGTPKTATFSVTATSQVTPTYQWFKDGVPLTNGAYLLGTITIAGATGPTLTVTMSTPALTGAGYLGNYTVAVSNPAGTATSAAAALRFSYTATGPAITSIPTLGTATPYPASVSGVLVAPIRKVTVTLNGLRHPRPFDLHALLVFRNNPLAAPSGSCLLMAGAGPTSGGSTTNAPGVTVTFDDSAPTGVPAATGLALPGPDSYQPTPTKTGNLPAPAPAGPYATTLSAAFNGHAPALLPTWNLYISDDATGPGTATGSITSWTVTTIMGPP